MKVVKASIPRRALINNYLPVNHYSDCYVGDFTFDKTIHLKSIVRFMLNYNPPWIVWLMNFRNILVKPFGLQTAEAGEPVIAIEKGGKVGFFDVVDVTEEEILLYGADKHLSTCLSVMLIDHSYKYDVVFSTTVCYHNILGRIYFIFVKPFHMIIVRSMINNVLNNY